MFAVAVLSIMLISCAKNDNNVDKLPSGPNIEWTKENLEKYVGTEIYCSFDSAVNFFENGIDRYSETVATYLYLFTIRKTYIFRFFGMFFMNSVYACWA